ncbi:hypothetical protein L593_07865 [Salinarchaeum sp. Harcht-Bsk1]|uniref:hypothetical protein n=1 Tax=Salinarchaeum sp. Harcht-Bsk1 TaxID=1333523 RepID=UPI000342386A|nr:hypothetical protein [Salinarchaeum sp. Harcht-Bsk1]AGN01518.1 hypothetical protein L593_07865 [Salinarchaeum sp. Harcht-Bsk1]
MKRTVAVSLLVVGLLLAPLAAAAAPGLAGGDAADGGQETNESFTAGERLSGAIGAERAELDGEVSERSFGAALAATETNDSAAGVVGERLDHIQQRLDDLESRNETLAAQYENGTISRGAYAARAAAIEAERASLTRQLGAVENATGRLPADALVANGVNASAIERLRGQASELGGQQVRELARSIAGPNLGNGIGPGDRAPDEIPGLGGDGLPGERGPEDRPGNGGGNDADGNETDGSGDGDATGGDDGTGSDADGGDGGTDTDAGSEDDADG